MLLDSNIIIYSVNPLYSSLKDTLRPEKLFAPQISYIGVLGFPNIQITDKQDLETMLRKINLLKVTFTVVRKATELRQNKKISLGDSIIAATAIVNDLPLLTANTDDFKWIDGFELINPLG